MTLSHLFKRLTVSPSVATASPSSSLSVPNSSNSSNVTLTQSPSSGIDREPDINAISGQPLYKHNSHDGREDSGAVYSTTGGGGTGSNAQTSTQTAVCSPHRRVVCNSSKQSAADCQHHQSVVNKCDVPKTRRERPLSGVFDGQRRVRFGEEHAEDGNSETYGSLARSPNPPVTGSPTPPIREAICGCDPSQQLAKEESSGREDDKDDHSDSTSCGSNLNQGWLPIREYRRNHQNSALDQLQDRPCPRDVTTPAVATDGSGPAVDAGKLPAYDAENHYVDSSNSVRFGNLTPGSSRRRTSTVTAIDPAPLPSLRNAYLGGPQPHFASSRSLPSIAGRRSSASAAFTNQSRSSYSSCLSVSMAHQPGSSSQRPFGAEQGASLPRSHSSSLNYGNGVAAETVQVDTCSPQLSRVRFGNGWTVALTKKLSANCHCQFDVWEAELIDIERDGLLAEQFGDGEYLPSPFLQSIVRSAGFEIDEHGEVRSVGEHSENGSSDFEAPLGGAADAGSIRKPVRFAIKLLNVTKCDTSRLKYKMHSLKAEGQQLANLSGQWDVVAEKAAAVNSSNRKAALARPTPQALWSGEGVDVATGDKVYGVAMEAIPGNSLTQVLKHMGSPARMSMAMLALEIAVKFVEAQRHLCDTISEPVINWDTKPGNVIIDLFRSSKSNRVHCRRAVVVDVGDCLTGHEFNFPTRNISRSTPLQSTSSGGANEPTAGGQSSDDQIAPQPAGVGGTPAAPAPPTASTVDTPGRGAAAEGTPSRDRDDPQATPCLSSALSCNREPDTGERTSLRLPDATLCTGNGDIEGIFTGAPQTPRSRTLLANHWEVMTPASRSRVATCEDGQAKVGKYIICTKGYCAPECAVLVFLMASVPQSAQFRKGWYGSADCLSRLLLAKEHRMSAWIDTWMASGHLNRYTMALSVKSSGTPRASPNTALVSRPPVAPNPVLHAEKDGGPAKLLDPKAADGTQRPMSSLRPERQECDAFSCFSEQTPSAATGWLRRRRGGSLTRTFSQMWTQWSKDPSAGQLKKSFTLSPCDITHSEKDLRRGEVAANFRQGAYAFPDCDSENRHLQTPKHSETLSLHPGYRFGNVPGPFDGDENNRNRRVTSSKGEKACGSRECVHERPAPASSDKKHVKTSEVKQDGSKDPTSPTAAATKTVEWFTVKFSQKSVVFSTGLVVAQLLGGPALLHLAERNEVRAVDTLCEWGRVGTSNIFNPDWPNIGPIDMLPRQGIFSTVQWRDQVTRLLHGALAFNPDDRWSLAELSTHLKGMLNDMHKMRQEGTSARLGGKCSMSVDANG